jgi:hypothetical protein
MVTQGVIALCLMVPPLLAYADERVDGPDVAPEKQTVTLGAGMGVFAAFPGAYEDPGPAFYLDTPLFLGTRHRFFQWAVDAVGLAGYGTYEHNGYVMAGAQAGFDLFLGGVFGFEFRWGLAGMAQLGHRSVPGIAMTGSGGYVFRFWDDDRKRVKLHFAMAFGGYFAADDPMNDAPMHGALTGGLAYEMPY